VIWVNKMRIVYFFLLLYTLPYSLLASDTKYPSSGVSMSLEKVSDHVYYVQGATGVATDNEGFISNATVVISDKGIIVVDSLGSPSLAVKLLSEIRKVSAKPIIKVIVTHYHADHIYGLQVFEDLGAEILAPFGVDDYLSSQASIDRLEERRFSLEPWVNEATRLVYPDRLITEETVLKMGDVQLSINYLGKAHSDADLTVFVEPDKVFITGDVIFEGRIPFVGDSDSKAWLDTLNRMADKNPLKAITLTRDYLAFSREKLREGVEEMMTFEETYNSIDWGRFEKLPAFGLGNRINAYQVFLSLEKEMLDN